MANNRKFTPSQLKWLAESLTNSQIAYLLEDENLDTANQNAGVVEAPQNPGMETTDNKGSMKPQVEQQKPTQEISDADQIKKLQNFVSNNKKFDYKADDLVKFLDEAGIKPENIAKIIKYATETISKKIDVNSDPQVYQVMMKNCELLLTVLMNMKNKKGQEVLAEARKCNVDVSKLPDHINSHNTFTVFNEGRKLCAHDGLSSDIKNMIKMNENLNKKYGNTMSSGMANTLKEMKRNLNESLKKDSIAYKIDEFFALNVKLKNLKKLAENLGLKFVKFDNLEKVSKKVVNQINENVSALKYAMKYYKENK